MPKINEDLDDEAHNILKDYKIQERHSNQGRALNALIKDYPKLMVEIERLKDEIERLKREKT